MARVVAAGPAEVSADEIQRVCADILHVHPLWPDEEKMRPLFAEWALWVYAVGFAADVVDDRLDASDGLGPAYVSDCACRRAVAVVPNLRRAVAPLVVAVLKRAAAETRSSASTTEAARHAGVEAADAFSGLRAVAVGGRAGLDLN